LRTTFLAARRRLCVADAAAPAIENWHEIITERSDATLERVAFAGCELVACWSRQGVSELTAHDPTTGRLLRRLGLPGDGRVVRTTIESDDDQLYFSYSEVARPHSVLTYAPRNGVVKPGLGGLRPPRARVHWHRSVVTAADGTGVPVTVLSM